MPSSANRTIPAIIPSASIIIHHARVSTHLREMILAGGARWAVFPARITKKGRMDGTGPWEARSMSNGFRDASRADAPLAQALAGRGRAVRSMPQDLTSAPLGD